MAQYSNLRALRALVKASLQSILKSPSAIVFSIAFPLVFILVFGFLGGGRMTAVSLAVDANSDTANQLYASIAKAEGIKLLHIADTAEVSKKMRDGDITGVIKIDKQDKAGEDFYDVSVDASSSQAMRLPQLQGTLYALVQKLDPSIKKRIDELASIQMNVVTVREFKTIDFILPGQLGFSLLAGSVFGTAFVFFNLRQTLVLKRFFATPVRREIIVLSEGLSRMIFQLMGAVIIIVLGHYAFDYTLVNGFTTFIEMILLSALGIMVFMGFGFIISGIAKSESTIPPLSNLVTLPQFLLAGTFFSIDVFPTWLQPICRALPLTFLNDALRKVAFDGAGIMDIGFDLIMLVVWGVVVYVIAGRVFRWE